MTKEELRDTLDKYPITVRASRLEDGNPLNLYIAETQIGSVHIKGQGQSAVAALKDAIRQIHTLGA